MRIHHILTIPLLAVLAGCFSYKGAYNFSLTSVERPENSDEAFGNSVIQDASEGIIFEDSLIKCIWIVGTTQFNFSLQNKTDNSIKIIWDEAAYIDPSGSTGRIMHSGVKYTDRNSSQPPTVIVRGAKIDDVIIPTENVYFVSGQYGGWREKPLFVNYAMSQSDLDAITSSNVGKTVRILLPIEIKGVVNEYLFNFEITGFNQTAN